MTNIQYSEPDSIYEDITIILFCSMTLFALAEMSGFFTSAISILDYPLSTIIPTVMVFFGILGLLGILTDSRINIISALLAVLAEFIIQSVALIINPKFSFLVPTVTLQILLISVAIFSVLTLIKQHQQQTKDAFFLDASQKMENNLAIEINNLKKIYDLDEGVKVNALQGVQLKVKKGDFIAIMGPSGSGKSTLLNCLGAIDRPSKGRIFIDGIDIFQLDDKGLAWLRNRKIGFIFQSYNLITRSTVGQNVEIPALVTPLNVDQRREKSLKVLNDVGLGDKYHRNINTLSGGEQQRVAIARALMNNPTILLADEPTGNLDSKAGAVIMGILQKLNKELGVTLIVVTHDPEVSSLANRIYYLRDGKNAGIKENIGI